MEIDQVEEEGGKAAGYGAVELSEAASNEEKEGEEELKRRVSTDPYWGLGYGENES